MIDQNLISELEKIEDPALLLEAIFKKFKKRAAIGTSGQLSGSALIAMASLSKAKPRIFTIDTLRLFPETLDYFKKLEKKYKIKIEKIKPDKAQVEAMIKSEGEFLFFDTKEKQELCCRIRKVVPNEKVLDSLDVWITGLRKDQSAARASLPRFQIVTHGPDKRPILKVSPIINWTEADLRAYVKKNKVPLHPLLEQKLPGDWYYESLGCVICTTPISPFEPRRAGRWRWFNSQDPNKECGLHTTKEDSILV